MFVNEGGVTFKRFQDNCGRVIASSCKSIWGGKKRYTLKSSRKQFSANARAEFGTEESEKLMGHTRADSPSAKHYGKANQAYSRTGLNYRKNARKQRQDFDFQKILSNAEKGHEREHGDLG